LKRSYVEGRRVVNSDDVTLPRGMVQVLYDLAINSLDFGSGFWGSEESMAVAKLAGLLGFEYPECGYNEWVSPPAMTDEELLAAALGEPIERVIFKPYIAWTCKEPKGHPGEHKSGSSRE
jgi:hypothetical protein